MVTFLIGCFVGGFFGIMAMALVSINRFPLPPIVPSPHRRGLGGADEDVKSFDATGDAPVYRTREEAIGESDLIEKYLLCGICGENVTTKDGTILADGSKCFIAHKHCAANHKPVRNTWTPNIELLMQDISR